MSPPDSKSVNIAIPPPANGGNYNQHNQSSGNNSAHQPNWVRNGTTPVPNGLGEKEQLALSDLLSNNFTASFWNFRTRFERLLLFVVFIVSILCVVLLVLMVFLLLNTSLIKGTFFDTISSWVTFVVNLLGKRLLNKTDTRTNNMYLSDEHFMVLTGPWTM